MHLPDINFWLALAFESHAHHLSAKTSMESAAARSCCFCRATQMGFLRLSTNRKVFPLDALSLTEAWRVYDKLLADERVAFADEPEDVETGWRSATKFKTFSTNVWIDAYLAAFARAVGWEVVTFDRGFAKFKDLRHTILT
jgi:uncharacterized protein